MPIKSSLFTPAFTSAALVLASYGSPVSAQESAPGFDGERTGLQAQLGLVLNPSARPINSELGLAVHGHGSFSTEGILHGGVGFGLQYHDGNRMVEFVPAELHFECEDRLCEWGWGLEGGLEKEDWATNLHVVLTPEGIEEAQVALRWRGVALTPSMHVHEGEQEWSLRFSASFRVGEWVHLIPSVQHSEEGPFLGFNLGLGSHIHTY